MKEPIMAEVDFEALLDVNADDIQPPTPLPQGHYTGVIQRYEQIVSSQKGTPGIKYYIQLREAMDDVDEDELEDFLKEQNLQDKKLEHTVWITEKAMMMVKDFFQHAGIDTSGQNLKDLVTEAIGQEIGVFVTQETSQNDRVFNRIDRTFKPES
jgi:hypothetical protein